MKSLYILFLLAVFISTTSIAQAQWETEVRLTNDKAESYVSGISQKYIASEGDFVHVVWYDARDWNWELYYKRSTDGGITWGDDVRLTDDLGTSDYPSIAVSGSVVHVVWEDDRKGNMEIYYKRSTDAGLTWGEDMKLTDAPDLSGMPSVGVSASIVSVVWEDKRDGNSEIYYKRSTDAGVSWEADMRLTNDTAESYLATVAVSGSLVHIAWSECRDIELGDPEEIYYKRSSDGGATWGPDTRLTNSAGWSDYPSISSSDSFVHIVWRDFRAGKNKSQIFYKRSADGGVTWDADTRLSFTSYYTRDATVTSSGLGVHVVWDDNSDIFYKRSKDGGLSWEYEKNISYNLSSLAPSISTSGSVVHVVCGDNRDMVGELYYRRNPTGNTTGIDDLKIAENIVSVYPNPFSDNTNIEFEAPCAGKVEIKIFNQTGMLIQTFNLENRQAGKNSLLWNCLDNKRQPVPSGLYYCEVHFSDRMLVKKMIVVH